MSVPKTPRPEAREAVMARRNASSNPPKLAPPKPSEKELFPALSAYVFPFAAMATLMAVLLFRYAQHGPIPARAFLRFARLMLTTLRAFDRFAIASLGSTRAYAILFLLLGSALFFVTSKLAKRLNRGLSKSSALLIAALLLVQSFAFFAGPRVAYAFEVRGAWPSPEPHVAVEAAEQKLSVALREALRSGGCGIAYRLREDPTVSLDVHDVPVREVLEALLPENGVRVRWVGKTLVIEPIRGVESSVISPAVELPAPTTILPPQPPRGPLDDLVSFGRSVTVRVGQDVRDVFSLGGRVEVNGRIFGSVVTLGGGAAIRGTVVGDVITFGGNVRMIGEGSAVFGEIQTFGGRVITEDNSGSRASTNASNSTNTRRGRTSARGSSRNAASVLRPLPWLEYTLTKLLSYAVVWVIGIFAIRWTPRFFVLATDLTRKKPLGLLGVGFLALVAATLVAVAMILSGFAAGIALFVLVLFTTLSFVGTAAIAHELGVLLHRFLRRKQRLDSKESHPLLGHGALHLSVGVAALMAMSSIPVVGSLLSLFAILVGCGAAFSVLESLRGRVRYDSSDVP